MPASKFGNVYYHSKKVCIELKAGLGFYARNLAIDDNVQQNLTASQKQYLYKEFGLSM